jgi:deoxyribodipyrimidine photo-lyase
MPTVNDHRIRPTNDNEPNADGDYILYWMQAFRRFDRNHALDYALHWSRLLKKPLVVYEGLRLDYPWASARLHRFMLDGMADNAKRAKKLEFNYWPYVETPDQPARGLLRRLAGKACLVVTDDYPAFIVPGQIAALASQIDVPLIAVDGNGIIPLKLYGAAVTACAHLRHRTHRLFAASWQNRSIAEPQLDRQIHRPIDPPFPSWDATIDPDAFIASLPIDQTVRAVAGVCGGNQAGRDLLQRFVSNKLPRYSAEHNQPDDPQRNAASGLSPYLRHGHISIQEIVETVLDSRGHWTIEQINEAYRGKREGFYGDDPNINGFLDEAICWRDVGYHWHQCRTADLRLRTSELGTPTYWDLDSTLPAWAKATLKKHARDKREHLYSLEQWEAAATHDPLWNAAQTELVKAGRIHNYLRMLWGKKVLEWSASAEEAYSILEHLNNKYALDGRDPNSYTGILWCFGLFDRPWPPERKVFGTVRYMSSANTAKKYKLAGYFEYIAKLNQNSLFDE